jgi:site-specific recombinase XerC
MFQEAVKTSRAVRRAMGFQLHDEAWYLARFARLASAPGAPQVVAQTAITWAGLARSEAQRAARRKAVRRFAGLRRAADECHALPPHGVFRPQRHRPVPSLLSHEESQALMAQAAQLGPAGS